MQREPLILYIIRLIATVGLFIFAAMLYWSSVLVENDLINLRKEIEVFKREGSSSEKPAEKLRERPYIDPNLPNLLTTDPFYEKTLPELLGPTFIPHGTFHHATVIRPSSLKPLTGEYTVASWSRQCNVTLARPHFGIYESMGPNMAIKIEERKRKEGEQTEFWIHLRDNVYWQPLNESLFADKITLAPHFLKKHPVTAHDFLFYYNVVMNPYVQEDGAIAERATWDSIESVEVIDDLTFVVRWKAEEIEEDGKKVWKVRYTAKQSTAFMQPLASFVYQYFSDGSKIIEDDSYRTSSIWAQNFKEHWAKNIIVSCGPWIFDGMTDTLVKFRRNSQFYFPLDALVKGDEYFIRNSTDTIWQDFKTGTLETHDLSPSQLSEFQDFLKSDLYLKQAANKQAIKQIEYKRRAYSFIAWNQKTPFFSSKKVRQAMTMSIDRKRIINQNLNGMGVEITGPSYIYSPSYDNTIQPWPFDIHRAKALLEEEGWYDSDGDGIIDKEINGKRVPFSFALTYYVKNPITKSICEYIATALKEVQINCTLNGLDTADFSAAFEGKSFDALTLAWMLGVPPEDHRQLWHSSGAAEPGSSNITGFSNKEADKIIEKLSYESDPEKRITLYHRFHQILHEEQPYTFLFTPKSILLYREYVQNVFIPAERQDLVPGANVGEPESSIFWIKE